MKKKNRRETHYTLAMIKNYKEWDQLFVEHTQRAFSTDRTARARFLQVTENVLQFHFTAS